jgi:hypothetical protein
MKRILLWTMLLVVLAVFTGGCGGSKDQIPTQIDSKPLGAPKLLGEKKGSSAQ